MNSSQERITQLEKELRTKSKLITEIQNNSITINDQYEELLARLVELQNQNAMLTQSLSQLKTLQNQVKKQDLVIKKQKQIISTKDVYYKSKMDRLVKEKEICEKANESLNNKISELEKENVLLKNQKQNGDEENTKLKSQLSSLKSLYEQFLIESNSKNEIIEEQKQEINKSKKDLENYQDVFKNSTYLLTDSHDYIPPKSFLELLESYVKNPSKYSQTKAQISHTNDLSPIRPKAKERNKKIKSSLKDEPSPKKKQTRSLIENEPQEYHSNFGNGSKSLSLDKIIKLHNKLWKEESQPTESIFL